MNSAAIKRIKSMVSSIMGDIRENTTVSKNDCDQVEGRLTKFFEKNPTDIWLISNIQDYAKEVTGRTISTDLAGTVSELMYSYSNMSAYGIGFTPEFVEKQILSAFDKRFTNVVIYPATNDVPPEYPVETNVADQFVAIGVLADAEPPKNEGDEELIAELGSNEVSVVEYAAGLSTKIGRQVEIVEAPDLGQDNMFETLNEIKTAVAAGHRVCWKSESYQVKMDGLGRTFIKSEVFEYWHPLTDAYRPEDFFLVPPPTLPEDPWAQEPGPSMS